MNNSFGTWFIGTLSTTPSSNTVLVTSGPLNAGFYRLQGFISCTSNAPFNLQILDGLQAVQQSFRYLAIANETFRIDFNGFIQLVQDYSIRIINPNNITGGNSVQASLLIGRIGH